MREKVDATAFRYQIAELRRKMAKTAQRMWPFFLFHFTDINNVVSILSTGELLSRKEVALRSIKTVDGASPEIINFTDKKWKETVRFYFRPRTPTLYRNEGIRPSHRLWKGAHCPVPVYLLFDFEPLICRADSWFSNGNLAKPGTRIFNNSEAFAKLPFYAIYDDSVPIHDIFWRQAVVFGRIDLKNLRYIWCRSEAERETLLELLPYDVWEKWHQSIRHSADPNFFNRRWTYVNSATLTSSKVSFWFNQCLESVDNGPFEALAEITEIESGRVLRWQDPKYYISDKGLHISLKI